MTRDCSAILIYRIARVRPRPLQPKPVSCAILILIVAFNEEKNDGSMEGLCGSLPRIANDKYATLEIG